MDPGSKAGPGQGRGSIGKLQLPSGHAKSTAVSLTPAMSLGQSHRGLGWDWEHLWLLDPWHRAVTASPGCRDIPEAGQALEAALTPNTGLLDSLSGDRLTAGRAPTAVPSCAVLGTAGHKPPGPDRAFAHEWLSAGSGGQGFTTMVNSAKFPLALREPPWLFAPALRAARSYSCPAGTSQAAHCWDSMGGRVGVQQRGLRRKATSLGSGFTPVPVPAGIHRPAAMPADGREDRKSVV